jgi:phosphatidylinositol alpha 1,6-mannosyltransferase
MNVTDLRIALFSGNYNMTVDGANKALNRLVGYLLRQGAAVRVYSPTIANPPVEPVGDLVSLPSLAIPGRSEYRLALGLGSKVRADLARFAPNLMHLSSPDPGAHAALKWARAQDLPILASVHTRFETYPRYYGLGFLEPGVVNLLRRFYSRCDALVAPNETVVEELKTEGMHTDIGVWSRGVDRGIFTSAARDLEWRRSHGIGDEEVAIVFLGRLVKEKGLGVFADTMAALRKRDVPHRALVIGDGPERKWFADRLPEGVFVGFQGGTDLGRAVACGDIFFNPSSTETFGNVTLEAMACGLPVVAAGAMGATSLVQDGVSGMLVPTNDVAASTEALARYCTDYALRRTHGAAGEERSLSYDWDAINQAVVDTYLRLQARRGR